MSKPTFVVLFCALMSPESVDANIVPASDDSQLGTTLPWISNLQKEFGAQHCLRFRFPGASPHRHGGRVPVLWERIVGGRRRCRTRLCNPGPELVDR